MEGMKGREYMVPGVRFWDQAAPFKLSQEPKWRNEGASDRVPEKARRFSSI